MLIQLVILIAALAVLAKSSDFTIKNAVKLSKFSGISQVVVGFVLIAVATSLPEFVIGVMSSLSGDGALSLGNLVGANIVNVTLIFGLLSFVGFRMTKGDVENTSFAVMLVSIVGICLLVLGSADMATGVFLLIVFYVFSKAMMKDGINLKNVKDGHNARRYAVLTLLGIFIVVISAKFVTDSAIGLAAGLDISESLIGATLLSIGTTLPELSVALAAVRRHNPELAIGDGLGSIVTNVTLVLGVASIINPVTVDLVTQMSILFMVFTSAAFVFIAGRLNFDRRAGTILLLMYLFYILTMLRLGS